MALTFFWSMNANSNTLGANDYSGGDTTATDGLGTPTFSASADRNGSGYGLVCTGGVIEYKEFTPLTGIITNAGTPSSAVGSFAVIVLFNSSVLSGAATFGFRLAGSDANNIIQFESGTLSGANRRARLRIRTTGSSQRRPARPRRTSSNRRPSSSSRSHRWSLEFLRRACAA